MTPTTTWTLRTLTALALAALLAAPAAAGTAKGPGPTLQQYVQAFKALDKQATGQITRQDLIGYTDSTNLASLNLLFQKLDPTNRGYITRDEWREWAREVIARANKRRVLETKWREVSLRIATLQSQAMTAQRLKLLQTLTAQLKRTQAELAQYTQQPHELFVAQLVTRLTVPASAVQPGTLK
jgi:Ca2+-binding EF-hand superfamily protein